MAKKPSPYRVIVLTQGFVAVVDAKHYRRIIKHSWHVHRSAGSKKKDGRPYARASIKGKQVYLHRFVMNAPDDMQVDHKNHCPLDCREENLEIVCGLINNRRRRCVINKERKANN